MMKKEVKMNKYLVIAYGYETPTKEIMDGWNEWFAFIGERLVERGSPLSSGIEVTPTGTKKFQKETGATGYLSIEAENMDAAEAIVKKCPIITSMQVFEMMSMEKHYKTER
jgi:hypothetical protein